MPLEILCGIQLALYSLGWMLAAWLIREERPALLHWAAYAGLQALSVLVALPALLTQESAPWGSLVASALGFAVAMRGLDVFVSGQARHDRWALLLILPTLVAVIGIDQGWLTSTDPSRWEGLLYSLALVLLLLSYPVLVWRPMRQHYRRLTLLVVLMPAWSTGLMALLSVWSRMQLDAEALAQMRAAAREPNAVMMLVMSGVFNIAFLFLLVGRLVGRLRRGARIDHLTGVMNRRAIEDALDAALQQHRRTGCGLAVALVDVDHFKRINDEHGHAVGDRALALTAATLRESVRPYDSLGRWGGEEFVLILLGHEAEAAQHSCERLRNALAETASKELALPLTVSIGLAVAQPGDANPAPLLQRADEAMYRAKREGRNRVCLAA